MGTHPRRIAELDKALTGRVSSPPDARTHDQRFRLGEEAAGVGGWDLDLSNRELIWSQTARRLSGVSADVPVTYDLFLLESGAGATFRFTLPAATSESFADGA